MGVDFNKLRDIKKELNEINFGKNGIITVKTDCLEKYTFSDSNLKREPRGEKERMCHKEIQDVCSLCEKKGNNIPKNNPGYKLSTMMHGAHSIDYVNACKDFVSLESYMKGWSDTPVLFLLENPSIKYDFYGDCKGKNPTKEWYFIHDYIDNPDDYKYPSQLRQGYYASMIYSLIRMFKLANAYATDVVKCGMLNGENFLGTSEYKTECVNECVSRYLVKEIKALTKYNKNLVIFAFSGQVYDLIRCLFAASPELADQISATICLLPHPASRLSNENRKYVLFIKVYKTLTKVANLESNCVDALKEFLSNDCIKLTKSAPIITEDQIENLIDQICNEHDKFKLCKSTRLFNNKFKISSRDNPFVENSQYVTYIEIKRNDISVGYSLEDKEVYICDKKKSGKKDISLEELKGKDIEYYKVFLELIDRIEG